MGLLDQLWDDSVASPQPLKGLGKLRKNATISRIPNSAEEHDSTVTNNIPVAGAYSRSLSLDTSSRPSSPVDLTPPASPYASSTPSPRAKDNVWRSVFHPGSNSATRSIGSQKFDKAEPSSMTVYDWLYSEETRSKRR